MNLVKKSLYLCIGTLLLLLGFQAAQSLFQVSRLAAATQEVVAGGALAGRAGQLWQQFLATEQALADVTALVDAASAEGQRQTFLARAATLRKGLQALQASAGTTLGAEAQQVSAKVSAWLDLASKHVAAEGVTELPAYPVLELARGEVEAEIGTLVRRSDEAAAATVAASQALVRQAVGWTVGALLLGVSLGFYLGWRALRSLHQQLGADASEVARVATAVAGGDLNVRIAVDALPPASVMAALARMQQALLGAVAQVRAISQHVAQGAGEIAHGNGDLSQRTEQQAAALERTASTMDQLGTTVRHNADNSAQASRLADDASAVAQRGGDVVQQAVATMHDISESSRRIGDIIGVIDGIAFQTNILALNAAVEAARAGEQGRGFAVVASEVRNLAGRSAEAAREIKALVGTSVERVGAGSTLVEQAGQTMQEVVQAIGRVTAVMAEIRTASSEQSAGVAQVGQAVSELDQATQQNAALAEQGAAAAEGLRTQAQDLLAAMAFFRLADAPARGPSRAHEATVN